MAIVLIVDKVYTANWNIFKNKMNNYMNYFVKNIAYAICEDYSIDRLIANCNR